MDSTKYTITELATVFSLLILHALHVYDRVLNANRAIYIHPPLWTAILTIFIMALATEEYIRKIQLLAFFGRFIRPGLKQLLWDFRHKSETKSEWIRGKKIPLLKVDIVGYTDNTYKMPYGVKRLYQDLWYSYVDRILEKNSFFDMPEGDGSIYCISDGLLGGSCRAAINAAEEIKVKAIPAFDKAFKMKLALLLESVPQLRESFENFSYRYQLRMKENFSNQKTSARFIFHYSWVDEGLWGLKTKSHYNVAGDCLIELVRLEKIAGHGDYLMTRDFYNKWLEEDRDAVLRYDFDHQKRDLKGIGEFDYVIAKLKKSNGEIAA